MGSFSNPLRISGYTAKLYWSTMNCVQLVSGLKHTNLEAMQPYVGEPSWPPISSSLCLPHHFSPVAPRGADPLPPGGAGPGGQSAVVCASLDLSRPCRVAAVQVQGGIRGTLCKTLFMKLSEFLGMETWCKVWNGIQWLKKHWEARRSLTGT